MSPVDLRSDTVTRPTPEMRRAMAEAEVGDDVYGEDPTIRALEEDVAGMFGKAAALFVPSGTMGNQLCVRLVVPPAGELICDADAHVVSYEGGGAAQHGGIQTRTLVADRGLLTADMLAPQLRPAGMHMVATNAVAIEQTHNRGGGAVYPLEQIREIAALCRGAGIVLHCDGARIWNAHVASGVPLSSYAEPFTTLSVCLSKGLGAPVGSLAVFADEAMVEEARAIRRRLGGGMRQAGVLAAAGRYALHHHIERLAEDHRRARTLADRIAEVAPSVVKPADAQTNIVVLDLRPTSWQAATFAAQLRTEGVLVSVMDSHRVRLVTHLDVDDAGIEQASGALTRALQAS